MCLRGEVWKRFAQGGGGGLWKGAPLTEPLQRGSLRTMAQKSGTEGVRGGGGSPWEVLEWPYTIGPPGAPPSPHPPKGPSWEKTKFTIWKILLGHFCHTNFGVPDPPRSELTWVSTSPFAALPDQEKVQETRR